MSDEIIRISHLVKEFKTASGTVHALDDVNLSIRRGEIYGIIGLSGAGKSTLVRCINYLERPTSGDVFFEGQSLSEMKERERREVRRSMGMIFQQFNLLEQRTVLRNICFPLELIGVRRTEAEARARQLLTLVGLADREKAYPSQLSGGQKQRVAIAGVMAMHPKCIVLDEPTAMLDPNGRKEVIRTVTELNRSEGVTVVLITHYMEEVIGADRLIVMDDGKVIMDGTPREVFARVEELKRLRLDVPQATASEGELSFGNPRRTPELYLRRRDCLCAAGTPRCEL